MRHYNRATDLINGHILQFIHECGKFSKLNNREIGALSELTYGLFQYNLWYKFVAIYPILGRSFRTGGFNLKDVKKYKINFFFNESLRFDELGVTCLGPGNISFVPPGSLFSGFGTTGIPLNLFKSNNIHLSAYNRTPIQSITSDGRLIGVNSFDTFDQVEDMGSQELNFSPLNNGIIGYVNNKINSLGGMGYNYEEMIEKNITGKGFMIGNSSECYLNNEFFGKTFPIEPYDIHPNCQRKIIVFGSNYELNIPTSLNASIGFLSVGYKLNRTDIRIFTELVENFAKTMFRSVM